MSTPTIQLSLAQADLRALKAREAALLADLDSLRSEIQDLQKFLEIGARYAKHESVAPVPLATVSVAISAPAPEVAAHANKKDRIINTVAMILADGVPRHTRSLVEALKSLNVDVVGADGGAQNLSAYLSKEKHLFQADRKYGWSLVKENPDNAPTLPGLGAADAANSNSPGEAPPAGTDAEKG